MAEKNQTRQKRQGKILVQEMEFLNQRITGGNTHTDTHTKGGRVQKAKKKMVCIPPVNICSIGDIDPLSDPQEGGTFLGPKPKLPLLKTASHNPPSLGAPTHPRTKHPPTQTHPKIFEKFSGRASSGVQQPTHPPTLKNPSPRVTRLCLRPNNK